MSPLDQYRALARYNRWINRKLYAHAAALPEVERKRDRGAFFRSIHGTLNHLLLGDRVWLLRFTRDEARFASRDASGQAIAITSLGQELYESFDELSRERACTDDQLLAWLEQLDEAALGRELEYANFRGEPQRHPFWWALSHLFNHQTHHRGQVTALLMQAGRDPGVTDMIVMLREEAASQPA